MTRPAPHPSKPCAHCSQAFAPKNARHAYCASATCQTAKYQAARVRSETVAASARQLKKPCAHCGEPMPHRKPRKPENKYCSRPCAYKAARIAFNHQRFKQDPMGVRP